MSIFLILQSGCPAALCQSTSFPTILPMLDIINLASTNPVGKKIESRIYFLRSSEVEHCIWTHVICLFIYLGFTCFPGSPLLTLLLLQLLLCLLLLPQPRDFTHTCDSTSWNQVVTCSGIQDSILTINMWSGQPAFWLFSHLQGGETPYHRFRILLLSECHHTEESKSIRLTLNSGEPDDRNPRG